MSYLPPLRLDQPMTIVLANFARLRVSFCSAAARPYLLGHFEDGRTFRPDRGLDSIYMYIVIQYRRGSFGALIRSFAIFSASDTRSVLDHQPGWDASH